MKLLHHVSKQHSAKFTWDYFATGHGKGVVDGIGGEAKSMVQQQVLSKNKMQQLLLEYVKGLCQTYVCI